ncbi:hypothetical protein T10_3057 [Trichinella papuae]|uniref:Uncharacterized protein n=1 Tax=Trichinella papuae TaxID=268474 RepID=A0A0V1MP64_9BILA|nr:hypothetical protein T10_3057 [Trichinella papuae]
MTFHGVEMGRWLLFPRRQSIIFIEFMLQFVMLLTNLNKIGTAYTFHEFCFNTSLPHVTKRTQKYGMEKREVYIGEKLTSLNRICAIEQTTKVNASMKKERAAAVESRKAAGIQFSVSLLILLFLMLLKKEIYRLIGTMGSV